MTFEVKPLLSGALGVEALEGVGGEDFRAIEFLTVISATTDTYAEENLTLQNIQRAAHWISNPERFVTQSGDLFRWLLLLSAGDGFHLRMELLLPKLLWSEALAVIRKRVAHCDTHRACELGRPEVTLRKSK